MQRKYAHVIVVGIDGAGAFIRDAVTPAFDRIFADGAVTYGALASKPSISAECWGSMLHGVKPNIHRLTNSIVDAVHYDPNSEFPSVFRVIRENDPDACLASFCNWNPINFGIVDDAATRQGTAHDEELTDMICDCIKADQPEFLFVQFDSVDHMGHAHGYGSPEHLAQIDLCDGLAARIYAAAEEAGIMEDTLFILTADHGGFDHGHGGDTDEEKYVFFAATGKTVNKGARIELEVKDIPAIVAYALGVEGNPTWQAKLPEGMFA